MKKALLLLTAAALLGACGHMRRPHANTKVEAVAPPEAGAPKPNKDMDWAFAPQGDKAALTYGAAGGAPALMMACNQHSGSVAVGQPFAAGGKAPSKLTLISGTAKSSVAATAQPSPSDPNQTVVTATFPTLDPIMQAFEHHRWVATPGEGDKVDNYVAHPAGAVAVKEFFDFCG
jgi:hypothetical protein